MAEQPETKSAVFNIMGQYAKDISFECPIPAFAKEAADLKLSMDVQIGTRPLAENVHETVLRLKVEAKNKEEATCYLAEVDYVGAFQIEGLDEEQLKGVLHVDGATIVYPFARQLVMSLVTDAGYRAPQLAPMNFSALYAQMQESAAQQEQKEQQAS